MSRETKQERVVRGMLELATEHLLELKSLEQNPNVKELDVERWCQSILRRCLGYTVSNGYTILAQEARGKSRPDLVVMKDDKPVIVVEVKKLAFDLNKSDFRSGKVQLSEYLKHIGSVKWGILCNGYEWRLYDFSDPSVGGIEIVRVDLRNENNEVGINKREVEDSCWDLIDLHESTYMDGKWPEYSKEETAFSPDSLAKAILSYDSVKFLAKIIRGEHEYKANIEVLIEKLYYLLENGLDDASEWNDTKKSEFGKFIKSQKQHGRRKKRIKIETSSAEPSENALVVVDPTKVSA